MKKSRWNDLISRLEPHSYAALRVLSGAFFAFHGAQKVFGIFGGHLQVAGTQLWLGGIIELVAGALIAVGLLTRLAAFLASGTMAVAYVQFHWKLAFTGGLWIPTVNQGELAVLFCFLFLFIFARGAGSFSLDNRRPLAPARLPAADRS